MRYEPLRPYPSGGSLIAAWQLYAASVWPTC